MRWVRKAGSSRLGMNDVEAVLERFDVEVVDDFIDTDGLPPEALLSLFQSGFSPVPGGGGEAMMVVECSARRCTPLERRPATATGRRERERQDKACVYTPSSGPGKRLSLLGIHALRVSALNARSTVEPRQGSWRSSALALGEHGGTLMLAVLPLPLMR